LVVLTPSADRSSASRAARSARPGRGLLPSEAHEAQLWRARPLERDPNRYKRSVEAGVVQLVYAARIRALKRSPRCVHRRHPAVRERRHCLTCRRSCHCHRSAQRAEPLTTSTSRPTTTPATPTSPLQGFIEILVAAEQDQRRGSYRQNRIVGSATATRTATVK
jgi:hypothetical protein